MKYIEQILEHFQTHFIQYLFTIGLILLFVIIRELIMKIISRHTRLNSIAKSRELYVKKLISLTTLLSFATLIGMIWEISFQGLSIYFASIFTVVGVGLFATWSILSNLTASVILFFFFPHRIGKRIKILDGENSVEGKIIDITLFYLKIETIEGNHFSYPNNLAIQKPVLQLD
ncbi:MAG: mechanosensitive ion channel family protein [bacterium]|nr:mechanosensitive ion channel family protein [bacterium]